MSSALRIVASGVAATLLALAPLALLEGCPLKNCDGSVLLAPVDGNIVDETTWESVAIDGTFLEFPGQRVWHFVPKDFIGPYSEILVYVSADPQPNINFSNMALATGNLAEIQSVGQTDFWVHNDTCATYYLRVVVRRYPPDAGSGDAGDASGDASGDAGDASGDAGAPDAGGG